MFKISPKFLFFQNLNDTYHDRIKKKQEYAKIGKASPLNYDSDLLHSTVHHPTKLQANIWNT